MRHLVHYFLHFIFPALPAKYLFPANPRFAFWSMIGSMAIDIDHLFADPIFDPDRCGIGFHYLHRPEAAFCYFLLLFPKKSRPFGLGALLHLATDSLDCFWMMNF